MLLRSLDPLAHFCPRFSHAVHLLSPPPCSSPLTSSMLSLAAQHTAFHSGSLWHHQASPRWSISPAKLLSCPVNLPGLCSSPHTHTQMLLCVLYLSYHSLENRDVNVVLVIDYSVGAQGCVWTEWNRAAESWGNITHSFLSSVLNLSICTVVPIHWSSSQGCLCLFCIH